MKNQLEFRDEEGFVSDPNRRMKGKKGLQRAFCYSTCVCVVSQARGVSCVMMPISETPWAEMVQ